MNNPHGGKLINRIISRSKLDLDNIDLVLKLDNDQINELYNIANGLYSPLTGYMSVDDINSVLENMRLANGTPWSIPVILTVNRNDKKLIKIGSQVILTDNNKNELGILNVQEIAKFDKSKYINHVYNTSDVNHPGVNMVNNWGDYIVSGDIWYFGKVIKQYKSYELEPIKTRKLFQTMNWDTTVGFQTRNPAHLAHEYIQKLCLEFVDGLFVNPVIGKKKSGDFKDEVILAVYEMLINNFYPKDSSLLAVYKSRMYYAGPREAVFHAIVRKNFGCTHFIVGRDHAGVGNYYDKFDAHKIFDKLPDIGIHIMKVSSAFYDRRMRMFATEKTSPFSEIYRVSPSGTQVREFIQSKNYQALREVMRDEVLDVIFSFDEPFVS
jgi:sulfate adenylyltransferase